MKKSRIIGILFGYCFSLAAVPDKLIIALSEEEKKLALALRIPGWYEEVQQEVALAHASNNDTHKEQALHFSRSYRIFAKLLSRPQCDPEGDNHDRAR